MSSNNRRYFSSILRASRFLWLGLLAFLLANAFQYLYTNVGDSQFAVKKIEKRVNKKINNLEVGLDKLLLSLDTTKADGGFFSEERTADFLREKDYSIYLFWGDSLVFWSDNSLVLADPITSGFSTPELITLPNVYGLCMVRGKGNYHLAGIIPLQFRFSLENEFLSNRFLISGREGANYSIDGSSADYDKEIHDREGNLLFGLTFLGMDSSNTFCWYLALIFNILALLCLLLLMMDLLHFGFKLWKTAWWFLALAGDFVLFRWLIAYFKFPGIFYQTTWFGNYSDSNLFFGSRGDALVSMIFVLFYVIALGRHLRIYPKSFTRGKRIESPRLVDSFTAAGWMLVLASWFGLTRFWYYVLAQSEDVIELHNILSMTFGNLLDIILLAISAAVFILILYRFTKQTVAMYSLGRFALIPVTIGVIFFSVTRYAGKGPDLISLLALLLLILICGISMYHKKNRISQLGMGLVIFVLSVYMVYFIEKTNRVKEGEIQVDLIENLANEHDPIAEMLLKRIDTEINTDSTLIELVRNPSTQEEKVRTYLLDNHFGSYWNRYMINVNVCDSVNMLVIGESTQVGCLDNWNNIKDNDGQVLDNTHFYYVDYLDGIIWYLGVFPVYTADSSYVYHLIISAESELMPKGLGYPEVLVAGDVRKDSLWNGYSYAKYRDCQLISWSGDYNYASTCSSYPGRLGEVVYYE
ncbi:MAG: hypothetical protein J7L96_08450, partial [Bacteroidales bacterium]|nr:hypothetical protein [Bacteroidales bacterium]